MLHLHLAFTMQYTVLGEAIVHSSCIQIYSGHASDVKPFFMLSKYEV